MLPANLNISIHFILENDYQYKSYRIRMFFLKPTLVSQMHFNIEVSCKNEGYRVFISKVYF